MKSHWNDRNTVKDLGVLSKPSSSSHESISQNVEVQMTEEAEILKSELDALKTQIINLKAAIQALQVETEHKEISIANLAREKEKISLDLLRTRRSNANLSQQLEDERTFYYKEKQMYCREMNECKKLKRVLSSVTNGEEISADEYKAEILKLKQTLNHTLEANYNLSIKFLRMKNTKTCLKTELQTMKLEHEKLQNDYKGKIENLTTDLNDLVNDKLNTPISPSSKKYLQLVKQNGCLVYENLCLQLEVDNLNLKLEKCKLEKTVSETNSNLKYIHHDNLNAHERKFERDSRRMKIQIEKPEKLEKECKPSCSRTNQQEEEQQIVKIYERKIIPGIPNIKIIDEKTPKERKLKKRKEIIPENSKKNSSIMNSSSLHDKNEEVPEYRINVDDSSKNKIVNKNLSKLALFQVSNAHSVVSSEFVSIASSIKRSRSTPDILMNTEFKEAV
ncbi:hypothetical protein JTB14_005164 [Gonioctena quinquepunctata]|nr:hypothetical protein JTB14_005164 [Gonioctena quinquepunctata]